MLYLFVAKGWLLFLIVCFEFGSGVPITLAQALQMGRAMGAERMSIPVSDVIASKVAEAHAEAEKKNVKP